MTARILKYRNTPVTVDGIRFDSKAEAKRWHELKLLERAGEIKNLIRQPRYRLTAHGCHICDYVSDAQYEDTATGDTITEDVKSPATARDPVFRLKAKLFYAQFGYEITITGKGAK